MDESEYPRASHSFMYIESSRISGRPSRWGRDHRQRSSLASPHLQHDKTLTLFPQTLREWLVNPLPKGSALTAIFDSCNSGTLLGNGSSTSLYSQPFTLGKISAIIGAITCIGHGSTRESVGVKPSKTASARQHRTFNVVYHLTPSCS